MATPARQASPPDHTANSRASDGGGQPGLGVAQAGSTGHDGEEGAREPTLQVIGHGPLLDGLSEDGGDHVGRARRGQKEKAQPEHCR